MKELNNSILNISYILLNPGSGPLIKYNNELYYIILMDGHYISDRFYDLSTLIDFRSGNDASAISVLDVLDIFTGKLISDRKLLLKRDKDI